MNYALKLVENRNDKRKCTVPCVDVELVRSTRVLKVMNESRHDDREYLQVCHPRLKPTMHAYTGNTNIHEYISKLIICKCNGCVDCVVVLAFCQNVIKRHPYRWAETGGR